jgi:hypothetical protein
MLPSYTIIAREVRETRRRWHADVDLALLATWSGWSLPVRLDAASGTTYRPHSVGAHLAKGSLMKRIGLKSRTAAISASVVLTLLATAVIGGAIATAQGDIHVVMRADSLTEQFVDLDDDGLLELGDRVEIRAKLFDAAATDDRVGSAFGTCLVEREITPGVSGLWRCKYLLRLADGTITVDGLDPAGVGVYELGVTGGTGAYSASNGEATLTDTHTKTEIEITFPP